MASANGEVYLSPTALAKIDDLQLMFDSILPILAKAGFVCEQYPLAEANGNELEL